MRTKAMIKSLWFILIPISLVALDLSKDTVYSIQITRKYAIDTIYVNSTTAPIKIDSIRVKTLEFPIKGYQLYFCLTSHLANLATRNPLLFNDTLKVPTLFDTLTIAPDAILTIDTICLDGCCYCIIGKRAQGMASVHSIVVRLYFFSTSGEDSLTIVSQQLRVGTIENPSVFKPSMLFSNKGGAIYNLRGQPSAVNTQTSGVYLEQHANKIQVRMRR
jgi:hypothetical protein